MHLGNTLKVRVETHDVEEDLPVVKEECSHFTGRELAVLDTEAGNVCHAAESALEEKGEEDEHNGHIGAHVVTDVGHDEVAEVEVFNGNIFTGEGLHSFDIT